MNRIILRVEFPPVAIRTDGLYNASRIIIIEFIEY